MRTKFAESPATASVAAPRERHVTPQGQRPLGEPLVERESVQISLGSSPQEQSDLYHPRQLASGTSPGDAGGPPPDNGTLPGGEPGSAEEPGRARIVGGSLVQLNLHQSFSGGTVIIGDGAQVQLNVHQSYSGTGTGEPDGGGSLAIEGVGGHSLSFGDQAQVRHNGLEASLLRAGNGHTDARGLPAGAAGEGSSKERVDHRAIRVYRAQMEAQLESSEATSGKAPEVRLVGEERVSISRRAH